MHCTTLSSYAHFWYILQNDAVIGGAYPAAFSFRNLAWKYIEMELNNQHYWSVPGVEKVLPVLLFYLENQIKYWWKHFLSSHKYHRYIPDYTYCIPLILGWLWLSGRGHILREEGPNLRHLGSQWQPVLIMVNTQWYDWVYTCFQSVCALIYWVDRLASQFHSNVPNKNLFFIISHVERPKSWQFEMLWEPCAAFLLVCPL